MQRIRAVIVDDEILVLSLLRKRLSDIENVDVVGEYVDGEIALAEIPNLAPDVVFLDVEMPEISGLELASRLLEADNQIEIVFVTAYGKYAVEAFKLNALHYILKPVDKITLEEAVSRIPKRIESMTCNKGEKIRVSLFGEVQAFDCKGKKINWITSKSKELFAFLLINRNRWVNKWAIIEALWPDSESEKSLQNLYTTVFRLKKSLKDNNLDARLENNEGNYQIVLDDLFCDWYVFEDFYHLLPSVTSETVAEYESILSLYIEDLFGSCDWLWSIVYREECYNQYYFLVEKLAKYYHSIKSTKKRQTLLRKSKNILTDEDLTAIEALNRLK